MNVLIADDDVMVLRTIRKYVEFRGDVAYTAENGNRAIMLLKRESIDLVITDIQMPEATGFDLLNAAKGRSPVVPVIIITGYANLDRATQAVNEGAFAFLSKPILYADLTAKMDEALETLQSQREVQRELETLQHITADQQVRLARAQALSVSILTNIPFPVCAIDCNRRIHVANPAFCEQLATGVLHPEGLLLERAAPGLSLFPFVLEDIFAVFRDPKNVTGFTLTFSGKEEGLQHFHVTGFALNEAELTSVEIDLPLTCLFMRDVTLRIRREEEIAERQWHMGKVSDFREMTHAWVTSVDFADKVVAFLAKAFGHYNNAQVQLIHKGQVYKAGKPVASEMPYLTRLLCTGDRESGRVAVFSQKPQQVHLQRVLMDDLVEILLHRIETHEFQMGIVQSERLRALGEMAAGVAHELNQPLTGIRTFAEGLLYGLKNNWDTDDEQLNETLSDIVEQVERASGIIDYMRIFARQPMGESLEPFAVADVINNALKLIRSQLKVHGIMLTLDIAPDLPLCQGRPRQIEQILLNLFANARHALDARIECEVSGRESNKQWKPKLDIVATAEEKNVQIAVSDTGGGIPEEIADRIFEPFFTSKEVGSGTGLGLSISRTIAQAHGGDLHMVNHLGIGATFYLRLESCVGEANIGETEGGSSA